MDEEDRRLPVLEDLNNESKTQSQLMASGFEDWKTARTILRRMLVQNREGLASLYPYLMTALGAAADPDRSLVNFERFLDNSGSRVPPVLIEDPRLIEILVTLFSASPFLTEILLRTPDALELLGDRHALTERKTIDQFQSEALASARISKSNDEKLDTLRRYQRRQLLRVGTSDFLGLYDLRAVFSQLSRMAIGLVRACLILAEKQTGVTASGLVVMAMGKLGGWELNYSSDIDLLFVANMNGDDYLKLIERVIKNIAKTTQEGFLYRVDIRLRPWGKDGPLITTKDAYVRYILRDARLWEKQAFLKARSIAGNLSLGEDAEKEKSNPYCSKRMRMRSGLRYFQ